MAETQKKINSLGSGMESAGGNLAAFDRMEEKVNRMIDEADAMSELQSSAEEQSVESLMKKYDAEAGSSAVDDELAALKAEMGL